MAEMAERGMLEDGAVVVVEHEADHAYPETVGGLARRRLATYGETAVSIYHYDRAAGAAEEETDEGS